MKIIKEHYIETWFSPKSRMEEYTIFEDSDSRFLFLKNNTRHRQIGPAMIFGDGEYLFFNNGQHHRMNGANYLDNQKKPVEWAFNQRHVSEEAYWNL